MTTFHGPIPDGGTGPPHSNPPSGGGGTGGSGSTAPKGASNANLITSTGGVIGLQNLLVVPFWNSILEKYLFAVYDSNNFDCEEDCIYNFRMEDVKTSDSIDIHKVYLQYRDLGKVSIEVTVVATLFDKKSKKETISTKTVKDSFGIGDGKIHSRFIDLKTTGERPQLSILRRANKGPFSLITAMLFGNSSEEEEV